METLSTDDTQPNASPHERSEVSRRQCVGTMRRTELAQKRADAPVIWPWRIDMVHQFPINIAQGLAVHARNKIGGPVDIVAGGMTEQASLLLQARVQFRPRHSLQQSDHRGNNPTLLNEIDLALKKRRRAVV